MNDGMWLNFEENINQEPGSFTKRRGCRSRDGIINLNFNFEFIFGGKL